LAKQLKIECSPRHVSRLLKQMGLSTKPKKTVSEDSGDGFVSRDKQITIGSLSPAGRSTATDLSSLHK